MASCSMYMNNKAILRPGNTMPTIGTSIDGKYDAVIFIFLIINIGLYNSTT